MISITWVLGLIIAIMIATPWLGLVLGFVLEQYDKYISWVGSFG